jgi:hypothetical protein
VREAVEVFRAMRPTFPSSADRGLASALNNLAMAMLEVGDPAAALPVTAEAVEVYRRVAAADNLEQEDGLALGLWSFAEVREAAGLELPEALTAIDESVRLYEDLNRRSREWADELAGARQQRESIRVRRTAFDTGSFADGGG